MLIDCLEQKQEQNYQTCFCVLDAQQKERVEKVEDVVKVGDKVRQGDVLVSSKIEIINDAGEVVQEQFVAADADIYIKHQISYKESCNNTYDVKHYCGRKNRIISLQFFSHKLELGFMEKSNLYEIY